MLKIDDPRHVGFVHPHNHAFQTNNILSREEAKHYQKLLNPQDPLFQEINRILITHQTGIFQLSNGLKLNATRFKVLGGGREEVEKQTGALVVNIKSSKDLKSYPYQAPPGKRIVKYECREAGKAEDLALVDYSVSYLSSNSTITETDTKSMERGGSAGVKGSVSGEVPMVPSLSLGAGLEGQGSLQSKSEKRHEESNTNQTVILEIKRKQKLFKPNGPVTITLDVWTEDLPEKKGDPLPLRMASEQKNIRAKNAIAETGGDHATQETIDRISEVISKQENVKVLEDAIAKSTLPKPATKDQMERTVNISILQKEIDQMKLDIEALKTDLGKARENYKANKEDAVLAKDYQDEIDDINNEIKAKKASMQVLEQQKLAFLPSAEKKKW